MDFAMHFIEVIIASCSGLVGVWLGNTLSSKRARLELEFQKQKSRAEMEARFVDSLLTPRIQAHQAVLAAMLELKYSCHYYFSRRDSTDFERAFLRSRDAFRIATGLHHVWISTSALEVLAKIDQQLGNSQLEDALVDDLARDFLEAETRIHTSLGTEHLQDYLRRILARNIEQSEQK
jgi:hypothetical protein